MAAVAGGQDPILERLNAAIGDRYEPLERIGGGGMAEVYLARHRLHGGFCAVKVLADHLSRDEDVVARFLQEAQTAAGLEGRPNIVTARCFDRRAMPTPSSAAPTTARLPPAATVTNW